MLYILWLDSDSLYYVMKTIIIMHTPINRMFLLEILPLATMASVHGQDHLRPTCDSILFKVVFPTSSQPPPTNPLSRIKLVHAIKN